jgi:hypothetical protein
VLLGSGSIEKYDYHKTYRVFAYQSKLLIGLYLASPSLMAVAIYTDGNSQSLNDMDSDKSDSLSCPDCLSWPVSALTPDTGRCPYWLVPSVSEEQWV